MRRARAINRLRTIAERCERVSPLWEDEPALLEAYAFGDVLEQSPDMRVLQVAFVLDLPAEELPWSVRPHEYSGLPGVLGMDKYPVDWYLRPKAWPVWNHRIKRPLRIWSTDGIEHAALDALTAGTAEELRLPAPSPEEEAQQFAVELDASLAHLRRVRDAYWEQQWRRDNRGFGLYPEHQLWDAVNGYLDLLEASDER